MFEGDNLEVSVPERWSQTLFFNSWQFNKTKTNSDDLNVYSFLSINHKIDIHHDETRDQDRWWLCFDISQYPKMLCF